ncbi:DUF434 domain-containing protein [Marinilabiliaceae bacterium JC017]|nr:DUF434 domain-containing protein [Marinilabiliaceae bacterium JC017]
MAPDRRQHRGPHQKDSILFRKEGEKILLQAAADYYELINKGYTSKASIKLVGDHFRLQERQRQAICRSVCTDAYKFSLQQREVAPEAMSQQAILIDGFNTIITLEALYSNAPLFKNRDQTIRDLSGIHGSYRKVVETPLCIHDIAESLRLLAPATITWLLDKPISNSGRLAALIRAIGKERGLPWEVEVVNKVDQKLSEYDGVIVSTDSYILKRCAHWFNLLNYHLERIDRPVWLIDLSAI